MRCRLLLLTLVACTWMFLASAPAQAAARVKALKFNQTHIFFGKCEVLFARTGIRVINKGRFAFVLVSSAPEWKVTVYRNDDKTYFTEPIEVFEQTGLISEYHISFRPRYLDSSAPICDTKMNNIPAKIISVPTFVCEYLPGSMISPQIERIAYGMYKSTTEGGFPLTYKAVGSGKDWLTGKDNSKRLMTFLSTQTIERVSIDPAAFLVPKSLKKVDSLLEVLSSSERRSEASGSFRDLFGK
jgi:hypothetical protein